MRALDYPFGIPPRSYALLDGKAVEVDRVEVDLAERLALLAYGSNAAPAVLSRKLAPAPDPVPVLRTVLRDFDVVYSAHFSPYGAIPATLTRSPGTEVRAFVAYLTAEQLDLVSATEPNYDLARFDRPSCTLERGAAPPELRVYLSKHGALSLDGREVALTEIEAEGRRLPQMTQRQIVERVRRQIAPTMTLTEFVANPPCRRLPRLPASSTSPTQD